MPLITLLLLVLLLPSAWALRPVNGMVKAAPALSDANAAAHGKEQGLDTAVVAAVKTAHSGSADREDCGFVE